jgi:hypothetical protein
MASYDTFILKKNLSCKMLTAPIQVAARPKAWHRGRSLFGIAGSISSRGNGRLSLVGVVCSEVEVSSLD